MASRDISTRLFNELEAMGFPLDQVMKALQHSGNSNISAAVSWLLDHANDPIANETPMDLIDIDIDESEPSHRSEQVMLKAKEIREQTLTKKEQHKKKWEVEKEKLERKGLGLPLEDSSLLKISESFVQERKNPLPAAAIKIPGTAKYAEQLRNCLISLKRTHKDYTKARTAFWTLLTYVRNVVNNPDDARFRMIRLGNPAFQARIGNTTQGIEFLELCGFERTKDSIFLCLPDQKVDMAKLGMAVSVLNLAITNPFFGLVSR